MNKFFQTKRLLLGSFLIGLFLFSGTISTQALASNDRPGLGDAFGPGSHLDTTSRQAGYYDHIGEDDQLLFDLIGRIINIVFSVLGLIFVILTIISGYRWMTARGNEEEVNKAKSSLKQSVIGLLIIILSWGIWEMASRIIF